MKQILIISAVFPPEPVVSANITYDIALSLKNEYNVTVITPPPTRPYGYKFNTNKKNNNEFKHIQLDSYTCPESKILKRLLEGLSFGLKCKKHILKNKYDLIYIDTWPIFAQFLSIKAAKQTNTPSIIHIHDIYPESLFNKYTKLRKILNWALLPIDKYILKNSSKIITICNNMREYISKTRNISLNKIEIVYNWQNQQVENSNSYSITKRKEFTFMFLGSLSPTAKIETLIYAFIKLNRQDCKLVIAGTGSEKEYLKKIANTSNLLIEFIDAPFNNVESIQSMSDVLVLTLMKGSAMYALPSKLTSYMLSKKPIIACIDENSDTSKIILTANCGWIVKPESINDLVLKMENILELDQQLLTSKGENGFNYANEILSKKSNLNKIIQIFNTILKNT